MSINVVTQYQTNFRHDLGSVTYSYVWFTPTNKLTVLVLNMNGILEPTTDDFYILDVVFDKEVNVFTLDKNRINGTLQQGKRLVGAINNVLRKYNEDKKTITFAIRNLCHSKRKRFPFSMQLAINDCDCWCNCLANSSTEACANFATCSDGFGSCAEACSVGNGNNNFCCANQSTCCGTVACTSSVNCTSCCPATT